MSEKPEIKIPENYKEPLEKQIIYILDKIPDKIRDKEIGIIELNRKGKEQNKTTLAKFRIYKKQMIANHGRQNKAEKYLELILENLYPGEWKFVGDGQVRISGKCPDFININGEKKIIELFGDYWHQGQDPQNRIDIFTPFPVYLLDKL